MKKIEIKTNKAPKAVGPYSQGVRMGNFIYLSGQIGVDPNTGELQSKSIKKETEHVLNNIRAVLKESKADLEDVVRVDIFITDMKNYAEVNEIYGKYFSEGVRPARLTVEVSKLPKDANIEISCIAYIDYDKFCDC